jgi:hypothetical protein
MPLTCDANGIAEAAVCLQNPCINEADRMAIAVLAAAYALNNAGGTDYTADLDALIQDSVGIVSIGHNVVQAEELAVQLAVDNGQPATVEELLAAVACLRCQPLKVLRKALQFLQCSTNAFLPTPP